MKFIHLAIFSLSPMLLFAQKVFTVDHANQADAILYEVAHRSQADILIYKVPYRSQADAAKGYWYEVQHRSQADWNVYWAERPGQATCRESNQSSATQCRSDSCSQTPVWPDRTHSRRTGVQRHNVDPTCTAKLQFGEKIHR